ncbi:hypothetical protein HHL16_01005 [Pseudoflavitalea sp. G-6-1-2]|uniref:glycosyl hydrolase family 95 catalytic domain-containing protein n=1 Tax=Pseudoflavitalea sp. G-6-1-2 TaxID=2728841 RepID=UPI00146F0FD6|nr:glycoside hydrolase N-terminal domain-containing protein [Pseudoflavitalea sp. G-6-1-2]NML19425.1 hypothetical protein [Pseudoflavitalea sp. G-6-1-2]
MRSVLWMLLLLGNAAAAQVNESHFLRMKQMPKQWDEAMPIGNGWLGALIWQHGDKIRLSLDRIDLWDDRPMPQIDRLKYNWVHQQVLKGEYDTVQKLGDQPYDVNAAPCKIPAGAIEFSFPANSKTDSAELDIQNGLSTIYFSGGRKFRSYVQATKQEGYFGWVGVPESEFTSLLPSVIPPTYQGEQISGNSHNGQSLSRLGYPKGTITKTAHGYRYHQPTYNGHYYELLVNWQEIRGALVGAWTISIDKPASLSKIDGVLGADIWKEHSKWWDDFWSRSSISIPDTLLEKQYYLDMYKFACVARNNTPPISLQAIWTADNGKLPPWKGDYHHDLNTELSYWPGYASNHTDLTAGFTNWLWKIREENKRWTKQYFGTDGLNVPGVTTISGKPMGGWIQYSMSPTTVCWVAQHFYQQWKYSGDDQFLLTRAYPYIKEAAIYLEQITKVQKGPRMLPLSSSPEYNDNDITAWFKVWTNYDLALAKSLAGNAREMALKAGAKTDAVRWSKLLAGLPALSINETGLTIAPGTNMKHSHRHMSAYMGIHPLGLVKTENALDSITIEKSFNHLRSLGTGEWVGYSFAWMGNLYARTLQGDSALRQLQIFASNFVSSNSFHLNGDQKGGQYSHYTYRPFTLEGNFAFAQGIHEMLLQSHRGYIEIFPALPSSWNNVSFSKLRTEGGFLVSARKENGVEYDLTIAATRNGVARIKKPRHFHTWIVEGIAHKNVLLKDNIFVIPMKKGQTIRIVNGFE